MKKLLVLTVLLASCSAVFADDINIIAKAHDITSKANKGLVVETYHQVGIKNTSGTRKDYQYLRCTIVDGENGLCLRKTITLRNGEAFHDHDANSIYIVSTKRGTYKITALTYVNDQKVADYAMLTVN